MGACCGKISERADIPQDRRYDIQQTCHLTRDPSDYPLLSFKALLSKIKLKGCNKYKNVGIGIVFGTHHQFDLKPKSVNESIARWDVYHEFDFKATQLQLRKEFIQLTFFQQGKTFIGSLKINLYLLATGPYHQDFCVLLGKQKGARLSFNLKIAQRVEIKMKVKQLEMFLNSKQFPGDTFAFNLKAIIGDKVEQSDLSYKFEVNYSEQLNLSSPKECQQIYMNQDLVIEDRFSLKKHLSEKRISQRSIKQLQIDQQWKKISWSRVKSSQMPFIDIYVPLFDIHGASFNLVFYSFNDSSKQFHSQSYMSLNKLSKFPFNETKNSKTKKIYQQRSIVIETKTWNHQKQTGLLRISADFILEQHIKQIQLCVRTENGILQSSPVFGQLKSSFKVPEEIKQLQVLSMQIQNQFIKKQTQTSDNIEIEHVKKRISRIIEILSSSNKQSKCIFIYQDENALLDGQRELIELGKRTKALLNEDIEQISELCWILLTTLTKRGEFLLAHMGYSQKQIAQCLSNKNTSYYQKKKQVALAYHVMLVQFLHMALVSFEGCNYESQRQFAQLFCAHAYFRMPKFRNEILTTIVRKDDPKISECRQQDFQNPHLDRQTALRENSFSALFDWQSNFYKMIQGQQDFHKTEAMLMELLRTNNWQIRMKKREGAFFAFVRYWVNYIQKIVINSKDLSWYYFPGYNKILRSFMAEMKLRDIKNYPESMKKAAASLLSNEKLINPFMLIMFRKTNLNDQFAVIKSLDLLSSFLDHFKNKDNILPSSFDLKLINKTFKLILEGEIALNIERVIILLYEHYKLFPVEFRIEFSLYLLTKRFFKLFLHWSSNVRAVFYHLIYIRIYNEASVTLQKLNSKDREIYTQLIEYKTEIVVRYRILIVILQSIKDQEHKLKSKSIDLFEKLTHKKIRKKIQQKLKNHALTKVQASEERMRKIEIVQLLNKLIEQKIQYYHTDSLSKTFKNIVSDREIQQKQDVIVKNSRVIEAHPDASYKKNLPPINNFKEQLVLIEQSEIVYVTRALEQYRQVIEIYTKQVQKSKQEEVVPHIKLTLSLDERQLRPQGILIDEEW